MNIVMHLREETIAAVLLHRKKKAGYTLAEISKRSGASTTTIRRALGLEKDVRGTGRCMLQSTLQIIVIQGFKMKWDYFVSRVLMSQENGELIKPTHIKPRGGDGFASTKKDSHVTKNQS